MRNFKLGYKSGGSRNYLCVETEEEISSYQLKMLEANEIPGLLRVHGTRLNGVCCLNYDITGMGLLKNALESRSIRGDRAKRLLSELLEALLSTEDYFLSYTHCLTELDYLYLDEEQKPAVAYLPFAGEGVSSEEMVRRLYQELLAEYFGEENDPFFMELLRYVNKKDFSVAGLKKLLQKSAAGKAAAAPVSEQVAGKEFAAALQGQGQAERQEQTAYAEKQEKQMHVWKKEKPEEKREAAGLPFAIPGAGQPEEKEKMVKEKPVKEKQGLFGRFLGGKKEEQESTDISEQKGKWGIPVPQISAPKMPVPKVPMPKKQEKEDRMDTAPESMPSEEQWHGTVMLFEDVGQGKTVMLRMGSEACLYHNNRRIDITHLPFVIGKQNADYVIEKNVISRRHATLLKRQGEYYIKDENSSNHTYVNGEQLPPFTERLLQSGDRIRLADEELVFSAEG